MPDILSGRFFRNSFNQTAGSAGTPIKALRKAGLKEGLQQGQRHGEEYKLIEQSCRKLKKGKMPEQIAEELEEELKLIADICNTAQPFAPDYDCQNVYQAWREQQK